MQHVDLEFLCVDVCAECGRRCILLVRQTQSARLGGVALLICVRPYARSAWWEWVRGMECRRSAFRCKGTPRT